MGPVGRFSLHPGVEAVYPRTRAPLSKLQPSASAGPTGDDRRADRPSRSATRRRRTTPPRICRPYEHAIVPTSSLLRPSGWALKNGTRRRNLQPATASRRVLVKGNPLAVLLEPTTFHLSHAFFLVHPLVVATLRNTSARDSNVLYSSAKSTAQSQSWHSLQRPSGCPPEAESPDSLTF